MTELKPAVTGDVGDTRVLTLNGIDSLSSATAVKAHVWNLTAATTELTAAVTDATTNQVTVQLGGTGGWLPSAIPDTYLFEVQVTFGTTVLTWPQSTPATLVVREQGA